MWAVNNGTIFLVGYVPVEAIQQEGRAGLSASLPKSAAKPSTAFMGVRISWDILERNTLLALLARLAWKRASSSRASGRGQALRIHECKKGILEKLFSGDIVLEDSLEQYIQLCVHPDDKEMIRRAVDRKRLSGQCG